MHLKIKLFALLTGFLAAFVSVLPAYAQVSARNDTTSCDGTSVLYAVPAGGVWTTTGGATIINPSSQSTSVIDLDEGENTFTYTVSGYGSDNLIITNNQVFANAGEDRANSCLTTATLSGSSIPTGGSGLWELIYPAPGVVIGNPNSATTNVSGLPFGNTIFVWNISANGCTASDEVSINNSTPENNDGSSQSGCTHIFYIEAEQPPSGGSGLWSQTGSSLNFSNISNPGVQITAPIGQYTARWTLTYNSCSSYKDFIIQNNLPNPQAGSNQEICANSIQLSANALLPNEQGLWTIIDPHSEIISNPNINNPLVSNLKQGITTLIWTVDNGLCIKSDSVQITSNLPEVNAGRDTSICTNTLSLLSNIPTSGTGIWTCSDSSVVFSNVSSYNSTVSNLNHGSYIFRWTVNKGSCPNYDEVTVQCNYVAITAGSSSSGCSDTLILNATPVPSGGSGYWSISYGTANIDNLTDNTTIARDIDNFVILDWRIVSGGCTYEDEIEYHNQLPTQAVTQADKAVCENNTFITANPPSTLNNETGKWTKSTYCNANILNETVFQTSVLNLDQGINVFTWTISNPYCHTSDLLTITNNRITTNAGEDQTICSTNANLSAINEGGTGYWTTNSPYAVIANSTSTNSSVSNLNFGSHTFTWTRLDKGCSVSDNVVITNNLPAVPNAGSDQSLCDSTTTIYANTPALGSGVWSVASGTGKIQNPNQNMTTVYELSQGLNTFRWTITYMGCSIYDDVNIYNNKIHLTAGNDQDICNINSTTLAATAPATGQTGYWAIVGGSGTFSNISSYNTSVSNLMKGINTFRWTLTDGHCTTTDQVTITNNTPDSAKVDIGKKICSNGTQINAIAVSIGTGMWSVNQGYGHIAEPNRNNTNVTDIAPGVNIFTWTVTQNGCSLSANQQITNNSVVANIPLTALQVCTPSHNTQLVATEPIGTGVTGLWTQVSAALATIETPGSYITGVSNLPNGESRFRWTVRNTDCEASDEITIVNDYYTASASAVGSPHTCTNSALIIGNSGPEGATTLWSSSSPYVSFSNPSSVTTSVQNLPTGQTTIFWTITSNGCVAGTSFILTNNSITTNAGNTIRICGNDTVLSAQALEVGQTGYWTASNVNVIFGNSLSPTSAVSNAPQGTSILTWTISGKGCTASDDMALINNAFTISSGNDQTICGTTAILEGSDPLTGTGLWTLVEGTGTIISPTKNVSSVINLSNLNNNIFRWTVTRNGCTASDDVGITNNLFLADVFPTADVCTDTAQIQAVAPPSGLGVSGIWTVLSGGGLFDNNTAISTIVRHLNLGQNQLRWTVTKGNCSSLKNLVVNNNTLQITAGTDQTTCGTVVNLYATPLSSTGTGLWTGPLGVTIENPANPGTRVLNLNRGINTFAWSVNDKGCTAYDYVSITNNAFDTYAGEDQTVTVNSATMAATLPGASANGHWLLLTGNGSFANYQNPLTVINNLGFGYNTFRWYANWNGCSDYDDVTIIYNVAESYAGTDKVSCLNTAAMNARTPVFGTGTWTVTQGGGTFQDANLATTNVTNIPPGTNIYRWTVVAFGVTAFDEVSVTNNSFTIQAGPNQSTCNDYVDLNAESAGSGSGFWYILQGNGVFNDNYINNPQVTGLTVGTNKFIWEVQRNGCYAMDTVSVLRYQPPTTPNAGNDAFVCNETEYLLMANVPSVGTGLWTAENSGNSIEKPSNFNTMVRNLSYGPNAFWWTISTANCQSSDQVIISSYTDLQIIQQPISQNMNENGILILSVEATGGVTGYQWKKSGQNLNDDERISGSTNNTLIINNLISADAGQYTCTITGYCNTLTSNTATVGVISGIEELQALGIKIYPNPSSGIIHIDHGNRIHNAIIEVMNLNGAIIMNKKISQETEIINLSEMPDGIYLLKITTDGKSLKTKVIIQK